MFSLDEIRESALALTPEERAVLAQELLLSLDASDITSELESAWATEAVRRSTAYSEGELSANEWEEVRERIRTQLMRQRES